jgi:hypothetical protein
MQRIEFCRFTDCRYATCRHTECRGAKTKGTAKIVTKRDRKRKREKKNVANKILFSPTELFLHHKKCTTWSHLHLGNDAFDMGLSLMTVEREASICQENLEFK